MSKLIAHYLNGGYHVELFNDGTKVRTTIDSSRAPTFPEQMDLKITGWCDAGCAWCHEKSTLKGTHCDVDATLKLLSTLPPGVEIAIGGGDPIAHPDFSRFVHGLSDQGLVPSVTVNGMHLKRHLPVIEALINTGKLFGVGVSYHDVIPDWDYEHMVVHLIAGVHSPRVLDAANKRLKILLLGYKQFGRGKKLFQIRHAAVNDCIASWYRELFWIAHEHHLSFDNLGVAQLKPQRLFADDESFLRRYMGNEGAFSMYVDAETQTYAVSSYSTERYKWTDLESMFGHVRQTS